MVQYTLGILVLLSASIQDHQLNNIIKCSTFLQVDYIQITQQSSVTQITLQFQPIFIFHHFYLHKHTIHPYNLH